MKNKLALALVITITCFTSSAYADFIQYMDSGAYCWDCPDTPAGQFDCETVPYSEAGTLELNGSSPMCTAPLAGCEDLAYQQKCLCTDGVCEPDPDSDADKDGIPDNEDPCRYGGDFAGDSDANGTLDCQEPWYSEDSDNDGIPNGIEDTDGDGTFDGDDNIPNGLGDADGDGILDGVDDSDGDGLVDMVDPTPFLDTDGDGTVDYQDGSPYGDPYSLCIQGMHAIPDGTTVSCKLGTTGSVECSSFWMPGNDSSLPTQFTPTSVTLNAPITAQSKRYTLQTGSMANYTSVSGYIWMGARETCTASGDLHGKIQ